MLRSRTQLTADKPDINFIEICQVTFDNLNSSPKPLPSIQQGLVWRTGPQMSEWNLVEKKETQFNHTAWSYLPYKLHTHIDTHCTRTLYCNLKRCCDENQAVNKSLRVICESQQGPTGRWLSTVAKSGPPLTCLPATSCLLVTPSPPPWRAVRLLSRWEAHEALWMSDRGPSPARTHHPACLPLPPHSSYPPPWIHIQLLNHSWTAVDGSWQPAWPPVDMLNVLTFTY